MNNLSQELNANRNKSGRYSNNWNFGEWSAQLFDKLLTIPNRVSTDGTSYIQIMRQLERDGFTQQQSERAEKWILNSPEAFQFRGVSPKLEYQDFYNIGKTHIKPQGDAYKTFVNTLFVKQDFIRQKRFSELTNGDEFVCWDVDIGGVIVICDLYFKRENHFENDKGMKVDINLHPDTDIFCFIK